MKENACAVCSFLSKRALWDCFWPTQPERGGRVVTSLDLSPICKPLLLPAASSNDSINTHTHPGSVTLRKGPPTTTAAASVDYRYSPGSHTVAATTTTTNAR